MAEQLHVSYFSDVLCVWAYVSQIRLDELQRRYGDDIVVDHHFIPIFASTEHRIGERWADRGGFEGYAAHVAEVCAELDHAPLNPDAWAHVRPTSSAPAHQFLKALQLLEADGVVSAERCDDLDGRSLVEETAWTLRRAFFEDGHDISNFDRLWDVTVNLSLPVEAMQELLDNGNALAAAFRDAELRDQYKIEGSPTFLLNHGRQKLYGNLGYKVIEANVEEVLRRPADAASWC
ncbi:MAG: DsbA family protein [Acidobacteriota bacterium]|jgi:predicted DsbA family dithiol-disulfide isomerase